MYVAYFVQYRTHDAKLSPPKGAQTLDLHLRSSYRYDCEEKLQIFSKGFDDCAIPDPVRRPVDAADPSRGTPPLCRGRPPTVGGPTPHVPGQTPPRGGSQMWGVRAGSQRRAPAPRGGSGIAPSSKLHLRFLMALVNNTPVRAAAARAVRKARRSHQKPFARKVAGNARSSCGGSGRLGY